MSEPNTVTLTLTTDQALVLYHWLNRADEAGQLPTMHQGEQNTLWKLEGKLEKVLVAPLKPEYHQLVEAALARVARDSE